MAVAVVEEDLVEPVAEIKFNFMKTKRTKDTTLEKILELPGAEGILAKYNLPCLSCPMAAQEISTLKIGKICAAYDLDLKGLLKDLNGK